MKIVLRTLCSDTKTQEKPATWKNKNSMHTTKKNIFKRSENAINGGTTEPTSPSLGIKSSTQTGLVFVFNHLLATNGAPDLTSTNGQKSHSSFLRKNETIIDVEGMGFHKGQIQICSRKNFPLNVNLTSGMLPFLMAINLNVIFQKN
jgi:hypothetical protein